MEEGGLAASAAASMVVALQWLGVPAWCHSACSTHEIGEEGDGGDEWQHRGRLHVEFCSVFEILFRHALPGAYMRVRSWERRGVWRRRWSVQRRRQCCLAEDQEPEEGVL